MSSPKVEEKHITALSARTFEDIALVGYGFTFDAVSQIERLLFLRHLPHNFIKTGDLLADGRVLNCLANKKPERHRPPFVSY